MKIILNPSVMKKIALQVIAFIHENTAKGLDHSGRPFLPYSTETFSMPAGAFFASTTARQRAKLNAEGDLSFRTSRSNGKRYVSIEGGYLNWKRAKNPSFRNVVDLVDTGKMLRDLSIVRLEKDSATIGFLSQESALRAYYHNVAGTGKKKKIRQFLGITPAQEGIVREIFSTGITIDLSTITAGRK